MVENVDDDPATRLPRQVIGLAIEVHRLLGPRLLERVYEECLCFDVRRADVSFQRQQKLPVRYKDFGLNSSHHIGIVIEERLVVEVKATPHIEPMHEAQLLTCMRLGG